MESGDLLFIFRSPPYSTPIAQEGVDALLAAAIFDQKIAVIFMGDGVFQLQKNQTPSNSRNQMKMLQSLSMYDIDQVFVQESALNARGLDAADLAIANTSLSDAEIHQRLASAAHILSF
jgi:sulfur relay protein TusC/DsrF